MSESRASVLAYILYIKVHTADRWFGVHDTDICIKYIKRSNMILKTVCNTDISDFLPLGS